jgi:hypothetical protein
MIAGSERRLATRTTFELNLFANRMIGLRRDRCAANGLPPPEMTKGDLTTGEV